MIIQWVSIYTEVEGNEQADQIAKQAVLKSASADDRISLAHVTRAGTEVQRERRKQQLDKAMTNRSAKAQREYYSENSMKQDQAAAAALKAITSCYYQLKISHAVVRMYL